MSSKIIVEFVFYTEYKLKLINLICADLRHVQHNDSYVNLCLYTKVEEEPGQKCQAGQKCQEITLGHWLVTVTLPTLKLCETEAGTLFLERLESRH